MSTAAVSCSSIKLVSLGDNLINLPNKETLRIKAFVPNFITANFSEAPTLSPDFIKGSISERMSSCAVAASSSNVIPAALTLLIFPVATCLLI